MNVMFYHTVPSCPGDVDHKRRHCSHGLEPQLVAGRSFQKKQLAYAHNGLPQTRSQECGSTTAILVVYQKIFVDMPLIPSITSRPNSSFQDVTCRRPARLG
jgi:hypothetical protein